MRQVVECVEWTIGFSRVPSVDGLQYLPCLGMLEHELAQPVVVLCEDQCDSGRRREGEVAVRIKAGGNPEGVGRQGPFVAVLARDPKACFRVRRHVEAAVAEQVERPVAAAIVGGQLPGKVEHGRFEQEREVGA